MSLLSSGTLSLKFMQRGKATTTTTSPATPAISSNNTGRGGPPPSLSSSPSFSRSTQRTQSGSSHQPVLTGSEAATASHDSSSSSYLTPVAATTAAAAVAHVHTDLPRLTRQASRISQGSCSYLNLPILSSLSSTSLLSQDHTRTSTWNQVDLPIHIGRRSFGKFNVEVEKLGSAPIDIPIENDNAARAADDMKSSDDNEDDDSPPLVRSIHKATRSARRKLNDDDTTVKSIATSGNGRKRLRHATSTSSKTTTTTTTSTPSKPLTSLASSSAIASMGFAKPQGFDHIPKRPKTIKQEPSAQRLNSNAGVSSPSFSTPVRKTSKSTATRHPSKSSKMASSTAHLSVSDDDKDAAEIEAIFAKT